MRDIEREIELLNHSTNKKAILSEKPLWIIAPVDLGNKLIKDIIIEKISEYDNLKIKRDYITTILLELGITLAYTERNDREKILKK